MWMALIGGWNAEDADLSHPGPSRLGHVIELTNQCHRHPLYQFIIWIHHWISYSAFALYPKFQPICMKNGEIKKCPAEESNPRRYDPEIHNLGPPLNFLCRICPVSKISVHWSEQKSNSKLTRAGIEPPSLWTSISQNQALWTSTWIPRVRFAVYSYLQLVYCRNTGF